MKLTIAIKLDDAAFYDEIGNFNYDAINEILDQAKVKFAQIHLLDRTQKLQDINGNNIGYVRVSGF